MTRDIASTLPMIELAEFLIENTVEYEDREAIDIAEWDRCDLIEELEDCGLFDEEEN